MAAPIVYFRPKEMEPAPEGSPQLEAPGNWFSVNNEMKLLPEVMSKLTFEVRDHAAPGDVEAEEELRKNAHWGRLYVEGWPASMQYLRGHFGEHLPVGRLPLVAAEPLDLCSALSEEIVAKINAKPHIVVAKRGTCTFGTKATYLAESVGDNASLATLLLVNNEPGNQHAPGPDAHEVQASVAMVAEWEGDALLEEMNASSYEATFVPINCIESSETKQTQSLCEPAAASDATYVQEDRVDGGTLSVSGETFEYLLAEFGRPFIGKERRVVDVGDGCLPTKEDLTGAIAIARSGRRLPVPGEGVAGPRSRCRGGFDLEPRCYGRSSQGGLPPALGRAQRDRARGSGVPGRGLCIKVGEDRVRDTLARRPRRRLGRARKICQWRREAAVEEGSTQKDRRPERGAPRRRLS